MWVKMSASLAIYILSNIYKYIAGHHNLDGVKTTQMAFAKKKKELHKWANGSFALNYYFLTNLRYIYIYLARVHYLCFNF